VNALQMIVCGVIFRINGQRQRFDGTQDEEHHVRHVLALLLHLSDVVSIGAMHQVNER